MDILKVSAGSDASATAGALANTIREAGAAELQGIGPKAINQAVKAIAIARSYLASSGVDLVAMPSFVDVDIDGEQRTALRFSIMPRHQLHRPHEDGETGLDAKRHADVADRPEPEVESGSSVDRESSADDADVVPRRPTSLSEAITGRPASELERSEADTSDENDESTDVPDNAEDDDDVDDDERVRRSSLFDRSDRSAIDTDRDVF